MLLAGAAVLVCPVCYERLVDTATMVLVSVTSCRGLAVITLARGFFMAEMVGRRCGPACHPQHISQWAARQ